ncbi:hypothetical protein QE389_001212 [Brevundimonas sp. SORGH_AS 993]|nr:hypothetical protein [Brevundimonas sp. SORGH_AS_0993]
MTPISLLKAAAPIACAAMTASCAASHPNWTVAPPRLPLPEAASKPCGLAALPPRPTTADLDEVYLMRGNQILSCDAARRLAVETLLAERAMLDAWIRNGGPPR